MRLAAKTEPKRGRAGNAVSRRHPMRPGQQLKPVPADLIRSIISAHSDPARLLELYYWSQEPALTNVMRAVIALPEGTRESLHAFLDAAHNPRSISVLQRRSGQITLSSH